MKTSFSDSRIEKKTRRRVPYFREADQNIKINHIRNVIREDYFVNKPVGFLLKNICKLIYNIIL